LTMNSPQPRPRTVTATCSVSVSDLARHADGWILDCEYRQLSPGTIRSRRGILNKLLWWLDQKKYTTLGTAEIRGFLAYVGNGNEEEGGRWGNPNETRKNRPVTAAMYHSRLRSFFHFLVDEEYIEASPMANLKPPVFRSDQIQPFTEDQVAGLVSAAAQTKYPRRDEAIILFLLDSGVRASELCSLRMKDVDIQNKKAVVLGKGNKHRSVYMGRQTAKAVWQYTKDRDCKPDSPLFSSERGEPLTRSGLLQLIGRLGEAAKIEATRCSPHTFRHTCAIWFLRNGGHVFALKEMLGHTNLKMTSKYVAVAQADVANQHMEYSPVERLRKGGRK
jgi:site-specific recombinase XerD